MESVPSRNSGCISWLHTVLGSASHYHPGRVDRLATHSVAISGSVPSRGSGWIDRLHTPWDQRVALPVIDAHRKMHQPCKNNPQKKNTKKTCLTPFDRNR